MTSTKRIHLLLSALSVVAAAAIIVFIVNLTSTHPHAEIFSNFAYYNTQATEKVKSINWKDAESAKNGLLELQKILNKKAPYLDTFTTLIRRSYLLLRPENTKRNNDTIRFINWHKAYLENLAYQKREQQLVDSVCAFFMSDGSSSDPEHRSSEIARRLTLLRANDSALQATHIIEDNLEVKVGTFMKLLE